MTTPFRWGTGSQSRGDEENDRATHSRGHEHVLYGTWRRPQSRRTGDSCNRLDVAAADLRQLQPVRQDDVLPRFENGAGRFAHVVVGFGRKTWRPEHPVSDTR